jgi:hypothetical protein
VGTDDGDGVAGPPLVTNRKGDDGRAVSGEVVLASRSEGRGPGVAFSDQGEASLLEAGSGGVDRMVG